MWVNRTSGGMIEPLLRKYFPLRSANIPGEDVQTEMLKVGKGLGALERRGVLTKVSSG